MGNINTKLNKTNISQNEINNMSIKQLIDEEAIHYILTMNFDSLTKMYQKEYCDKLVILTSKIIEKQLNPSEIIELLKDIKQDNKDTFDSNKKQMSNEIAKFYIQIAHIYAVIIKTINPMYVYKNSDGETVEVPFSEQTTIPDGIKPDIKSFNICDKHIGDLGCIMDNKCENVSSSTDEPGIPELQQLYQDDEYDFSEGVFKGMSEQTKAEYLNDLLLFYNVFTDSKLDTLPENIKTFNDIKLSKYSHSSNNSFAAKTNMNTLLKEYAENIKNMMHNMQSNREILLNVINKLFIYKTKITINPNLKESDLPNIILETRRAIVELYLTCERDYTRGMEIYEAIVDKKILDSTEKQIEYFNSLLDKVHE